MPYIEPDKRPPLDEALEPLIEELKKLPLDKQDGGVNYAFTKLLKAIYGQKYFDLNRSMGVLSAVQAEWYRRVIAPYEDDKIQQNGDL